MGNLAHEYKGTFAGALERAEQALQSVQAEALAKSHAEWLAGSQNELERLCHSLREEHRRALQVLAQEIRTEYHVALAQSAEEDRAAHLERDTELTKRLFAQAGEFLAKWQAGAEARLTDLERRLSAEFQGHLGEHQAQVLSLHQANLTARYEHWLALCTERLAAAKGELAGDFAGLPAELKTGMRNEYKADLVTFREQMYGEYRGRLGKLADDLAAKHTSALAAAVTPPATRQRR